MNWYLLTFGENRLGWYIFPRIFGISLSKFLVHEIACKFTYNIYIYIYIWLKITTTIWPYKAQKRKFLLFHFFFAFLLIVLSRIFMNRIAENLARSIGSGQQSMWTGRETNGVIFFSITFLSILLIGLIFIWRERGIRNNSEIVQENVAVEESWSILAYSFMDAQISSSFEMELWLVVDISILTIIVIHSAAVIEDNFMYDNCGQFT